MKRLTFATGIAILLMAMSCSSHSDWTDLIDKDLSLWRPYQSYTGNFRQGRRPVDADGQVIKPVGYDVNLNDQWTVIEEDGDLVIRNSGEYYGCLATTQEFSNYHLQMQYRFGVAKYEPRADRTRDSGLQYHAIGECGVRDPYFSWMTCNELQLMESGTIEGEPGDYHSNAGATVDALCSGPVEGFFGKYVADPEGEWHAICPHGSWSYCAAEDFGSPYGEWTQLDLICFEDKVLHIVNGHLVMILRNSRYWNGEAEVPLTSGKIALQSEAAEIFYKNIRIRPIGSLPEEYSKYYE